MDNNNNNIYLIPFSLKSFSLSDFKSIIQKYSHFNNNTSSNTLISPSFLHIFDSNKDYVGYLEFKLAFDTPSGEDDSEYELGVHLLKHYMVKACSIRSNKFAFFLPDPYLFYIHIYDKNITDEI
jgi:hypothetical protein